MNQERSLAHYRRALEVHTRDAFPANWAKIQSNLGMAYSVRLRGKRADNVRRAVSHYHKALEVRTPDSFPAEHRQTQKLLAQLCFVESRWEEAADAYRSALAANETLYLSAATSEARQFELAELEEVPARLALALAMQSGADESRLEEALLVVEQNRARWLREELDLRSGKPEAAPRKIWRRFRESGRRMREMQAEARLPEGTPGRRDYLTLSALLREAYSELETRAAQIRAIDPDFMPAPSMSDIQESAQSAPLVYLMTTPVSGLALVVLDEGVLPVWLDLSETELAEWLEGAAESPRRGGWLGAYHRRNDSEAGRRAWLDVLDRTTAALWDRVMGPVASCLREFTLIEGGEAPPVVLIPAGLLSLLPLHAAWKEQASSATGRHYLLDEFSVSYAPSATALRHARVLAGETPAAPLLAVEEPQPVRGPDLPNSRREVEAIASAFAEKSVLRREEATRQNVLNTLPAARVAHFCCHGSNDWSNPLESGLLLAGDRELTMRDVLTLERVGGRLATLSACETGLVGTALPDEVVSLPSALVRAGFAAVAASLWSVSDIGTAMLMERFYRLWREENLEPAEALRKAQRWLRDTTNSQKADHYKRHISALGGGEGGMEELVAVDFYYAMMSHPTGREAQAFQHPFWWAAFYLTGV